MGFATLNPANAFPPSLIPHQKKMATGQNYLAFNSDATGDTNTFAQQYLPELYEAEVERYGNRTIGGFLRMVGAEMPMSSDQVIWSEQNRLHISYQDVIKNGTHHIDIPIEDGKECVIRENATIVISDGINTVKALVKTVGLRGTPVAGKSRVLVEGYQVANLSTLASTATLKVFVYGYEYAKGTVSMSG